MLPQGEQAMVEVDLVSPSPSKPVPDTTDETKEEANEGMTTIRKL